MGFLLLGAGLAVQVSFAQTTAPELVRLESLRKPFPEIEISVDPTNRLPALIRGLDRRSEQLPHASPMQAVSGFFLSYGAMMYPSLAAGLQIKPVRSSRDPDFDDVTQVVVQQTYRGVEVYGGTATIAVRERGARNFIVESLSSVFRGVPASLSVAPEVGAERALEVANQDYVRMLERNPARAGIERTLGVEAGAKPAPAQLIVYVDEAAGEGVAKLAFRVSLGSYQYIIDARNASIIRRLPQAKRIAVRETSDAMNLPASGTPVLVDDIELVANISSEARESHAILGRLHGYWLKRFSRRSYDGNGATMYMTARIGGWDTAMWFRNRAFFATGYATSPEVVSHEFAHGLFEALDRLYYADQPGALNESLADFFGVAFRASITGQIDWRIGLDLPGYKARGVPLRDMKNPVLNGFDRASQANPYTNNGQPAHFSELVRPTDPICAGYESSDQGCVHFNGAIFSKALQLMVDGGVAGAVPIHGIGLEKVERMLFRALVTKFGPLTDLRSGAAGMVESCRELFAKQFSNLPSLECTGVEHAFRSVGLR